MKKKKNSLPQWEMNTMYHIQPACVNQRVHIEMNKPLLCFAWVFFLNLFLRFFCASYMLIGLHKAPKTWRSHINFWPISACTVHFILQVSIPKYFNLVYFLFYYVFLSVHSFPLFMIVYKLFF